ncbi:MAG TPA: hypothetical protein VGD55_02595 [Acidothermaceae bacterium]
MGLRRTAFAAATISLAMLAGCSAASHPSALGPAASAPIAVAPSVGPSAPPNSVAASPQPSASASASTESASTAGTPTTAADSPPPALSSNDVAANVRATAQAFFADLNIAFATGDLTSYNTLTSPGCVCRSIARTIQDMNAEHEHYSGVVATITSLQVVSFIAAGATADIYFSVSAGKVLDAAGKQVDTSLAAPAAHSAMFILRVGPHWIVEQNTRLDPATP